jgi:nucleoside-diphosphate-sugar epimerase/predicted dehydrogenase
MDEMTSAQEHESERSTAARPGVARAGGKRRVALLGAGYIADWHAQALQSVDGVELVAVCDRYAVKAEALARKFGGLKTYWSLEAMLAAEDLTAVHVLTPPDRHFEAARTVLEAGVDVFLEKPMCAVADDCDALVRLAEERGRRLGVGHNFLFAEVYEQLRHDVKSGVLGLIDDVTITWHKPLPQAVHGPFDTWMLREPKNILIEVGSHSVAHMLDLAGEPGELGVRASNAIELPTGKQFYRRWQVNALKGRTTVELRFSFVPGFPEHTIHVRGSLAAATVDFERNTYTLDEHRPSDPDFENHAIVLSRAKSLKKQARRTLGSYIKAKLKLGKRGNPYGASIARAMDAFYSPLALDERVDGRMGARVIRICARLGELGDLQSTGLDATDLKGHDFSRATEAANKVEALAGEGMQIEQQALPHGLKPNFSSAHVDGTVETVPFQNWESASSRGSLVIGGPAQILVLGGTGFIGRELVRRLIGAGLPVRALVRSQAGIPAELRAAPNLECVVGDLASDADLMRAMAGVETVFHLARAHVKSWADYQEFEIEATRRVAECALARGVKRFIYTGTIDSYYAGSRAGTITEETPLDPRIERRNLYARAKAASEEVLTRMHRERGLPLVIVRPGIVIGRGGSPFHWGAGMWWNDAVCQIWGDGKSKLALVLVEDVAAGLIAAMKTPGIEGRSFNLVGGPLLTAREYLDELDRAGGIRIQRHATPIARFYLTDLMKWMVKTAVRHPERRLPSYRDWESRTGRAVFDCSAAKAVLGWKPVGDREELVRLGIVEPFKEFTR